MGTVTRDQPYASIHSLAAAAAPATGDAVHFTEEMPVAISALVQKTGSPTFSIVIEQSGDGTTWTPVGSALTAEGSTTLSAIAAYTRARLASISGGGSVDVYLGAAGQTSGTFTQGPTGATGATGAQGPTPSWLANPVGVPNNIDGVDGDWAFSGNGHIYFKTAGAWVQKV